MPTPLASRLQRTGDSYLVEDTDIRGGYRSVADLTARNAIPLAVRRVGMTVYCIAEKTEYQLLGTITNTSWTARALFSGMIHQVGSVVSIGALQQFDPYTFEQYARQLVVEWFNTLPEINRVLATPIYYFKILCAVGDVPSLYSGSTLPEDVTYLGDSTFVYNMPAAATPVTLTPSMLIGISKTLIPLGDAVITAMNEYAERKAGE